MCQVNSLGGVLYPLVAFKLSHWMVACSMLTAWIMPWKASRGLLRIPDTMIHLARCPRYDVIGDAVVRLVSWHNAMKEGGVVGGMLT